MRIICTWPMNGQPVLYSSYMKVNWLGAGTRIGIRLRGLSKDQSQSANRNVICPTLIGWSNWSELIAIDWNWLESTYNWVGIDGGIGSFGLDSLSGSIAGSSSSSSGFQSMGTNLGLLVNGGSPIGPNSVGGPSLSPHDASLLASALSAPSFVPSNPVNYGMRYKRSDISSGSSLWRH